MSKAADIPFILCTGRCGCADGYVGCPAPIPTAALQQPGGWLVAGVVCAADVHLFEKMKLANGRRSGDK